MRARHVAAGFLLLGAVAVFPSVAAAQVSCHCFRDREYDPSAPARTDPYLLATAANSLLAAATGIPKGDIVRARMSGTSRDDLWISAYAALRVGGDRAELLAARAGSPSWREMFQKSSFPLEQLGTRFVTALAGTGGDAVLGRAAAAETLAEGVGTPARELDELARRSASLQETVLAALLGRWGERAAPEVLAEVRAGKISWSGELARLGFFPGGVEEQVSRTLGKPAPGKKRPPP